MIVKHTYLKMYAKSDKEYRKTCKFIDILLFGFILIYREITQIG